MSDPRRALRAMYARWLRVRANVRALATSLAAAEHALRRDAAATNDPELTTLVKQVCAQRHALDELGRDLDARIAEVKRDCAAIETQHIVSLAGAARRGVSATP